MLFVRGLGLGASIQPTIAAAYALLDSSQVPRATAALNALRQAGASIGTALLAVVLQHEGAAALPAASGGTGGLLAPLPPGEREQISGPVATAFGHTFMWALVMALLAIVPAVALLRAERADRRPSTLAGAETAAAEPAPARRRGLTADTHPAIGAATTVGGRRSATADAGGSPKTGLQGDDNGRQGAHDWRRVSGRPPPPSLAPRARAT